MRLPSSGYTIVEALMVLAISGMLFVSVTTLISGQQSRTEFTSTVRDFESKLQDVMNDVSNGYYPSADNIDCSATPSGSYNITNPGTDKKGTNESCTFVGKVVQFAPAPEGGDQDRQMSIYSIVGSRQYVSGGETKEPRTIAEARPAVPDDPNQLSDRYFLNSGLVFRDVIIGSTHNYGAFAMLGSFGQTAGAESGSVVSSGGNETSLAELPNVSLHDAFDDVKDGVKNNLNPPQYVSSDIIICVGDQGSDGRRAAVKISGRGTEILMDESSIDAGCPA